MGVTDLVQPAGLSKAAAAVGGARMGLGADWVGFWPGAQTGTQESPALAEVARLSGSEQHDYLAYCSGASAASADFR